VGGVAFGGEGLELLSERCLQVGDPLVGVDAFGPHGVLPGGTGGVQLLADSSQLDLGGVPFGADLGAGGVHVLDPGRSRDQVGPDGVPLGSHPDQVTGHVLDPGRRRDQLCGGGGVLDLLGVQRLPHRGQSGAEIGTDLLGLCARRFGGVLGGRRAGGLLVPFTGALGRAVRGGPAW
jgi:hypothetical protein